MLQLPMLHMNAVAAAAFWGGEGGASCAAAAAGGAESGLRSRSRATERHPHLHGVQGLLRHLFPPLLQAEVRAGVRVPRTDCPVRGQQSNGRVDVSRLGEDLQRGDVYNIFTPISDTSFLCVPRNNRCAPLYDLLCFQIGWTTLVVVQKLYNPREYRR